MPVLAAVKDAALATLKVVVAFGTWVFGPCLRGIKRLKEEKRQADRDRTQILLGWRQRRTIRERREAEDSAQRRMEYELDRLPQAHPALSGGVWLDRQ